MNIRQWNVEMTPEVLLEVCHSFEEEYKLSSHEFYARYLSGEFVGVHDAYRWAGYWKEFLEIRGDTPAVAQLRKGTSKELLDSGV